MTHSSIKVYDIYGHFLKSHSMCWFCQWRSKPISLKRIPIKKNHYLCDKK